MKNRIAVFQYDFPIQSYTKNLIISLEEAGYKVDLFTTYESTCQNLVNLKEVNNKNIEIYIQRDCSLRAIRVAFKVLNIFSDRTSRNKQLIDPIALNNSKRIIKKNLSEYLCFIGIEKQGLIWAGKISEETNIPYIYYSLELYIEDHPAYKKLEEYIKEEMFYHQKAMATIIQDKCRAEALLKCNKVSDSYSILFPISVKGNTIREKGNYFQDKFGIPSDSKIALYFGMICKQRYSTSLNEIAERIGENYLVFHGYGEKNYLNTLKKSQNVIISTDLVDEKKKLDVISSAHVGISLYDNTLSNDRLTAFSSEKVALYMQVGLPIISFRNESYEELFSNFKCGEMIESIDEFPAAFNKILQNYESYREECFRAFDQYYSFDKNFKSVLEYLDHLKDNT